MTATATDQTFLLPDLGEGLTEASVVQWLVAEGDVVAVDQPVVEVETAKSVVEVPSPYAGRVGVLHAPGFNRFSRAWLVVDTGGHRLLRQSIRGRRRYEIPHGAPFSISPGTWADLLEVDVAAEKLRILLLKDGPAPALVARSLAQEPLSEASVDN